MEGTYALPEAQRDRFMARIAMGYPDDESELAMLNTRDTSSPLSRIGPVVTVRAAAGHDGDRPQRLRLDRR